MKLFNVVVAGCGGMSNTWINYIKNRNECKIVGLCDIIIERTYEHEKKYNLECKKFADIKELKNQCPNANLVVDCTTPDAHELITTTAMRLGCDVIGEKPMAETREQALNQINVSYETKKSYAVMQNRIYLPGMRAIREAANLGVIGKIGSIFSDFFIGAHFGGFRDLMDNVLVLDMAVHTFYQAKFLMNAKPVSVYCHEWNPAGSWYRGNASAVAIFEFDNGGVYEYRGSWCSEGLNTSWECDWRIIGDGGTIKWDGGNNIKAECVDKKTEGFIRRCEQTEIKMPPAKNHYGHEGCFDEMFDALIERRPAETDCRENYISMNMVYGAIESAKKGVKVSL